MSRLRRLALLALAVTPLAALPVAQSGAATRKTAKPAFGILVTNDDGVKAPGIDAIVTALRKEPGVEVTVVAPARNQSGTGGKTTAGGVSARKTTTRSGYPAWSVDGFPADSVVYALKKVIRTSEIKLVVSGINQGANLGPFVDLSGTVGAARAAAKAGLPALATSTGTPSTTDFAPAVATTIAWVRAHRASLKKGTVRNLNTPQCSTGAVRGTIVVPSTPKLADGVNPFVAVDCTQTAPATGGDVGSFLLGYATVTSIPVTPAS